jgi:hypothetical protein
MKQLTMRQKARGKRHHTAVIRQMQALPWASKIARPVLANWFWHAKIP